MRQLRVGEKVDFVLNRRLAIRIYADCRPHVLQTAKLQKGAILVFNGRELVEEGLGIGAPVCLYGDGARFSLTATTFVKRSKIHPSIVKIYSMNAIELKRFRRGIVRPGSYAKLFLRILERAYREIRSLNIGARLMLDIASMMGLRNEYSKCRSKGEIQVTYSPSKAGLRINVDFESLTTKGLKALIVGNEQGGKLFTEYSDSSGGKLEGREIEPWSPTSAGWAILASPQFDVAFKLRRPDGWRIVRGREVVENRISWSGLNLMYDGIPASKTLEYLVETLGAA